MQETIVDSTGNIFADLGFEPGEAAILQMRAKLMLDLQEFIVSNDLTPREVAEHLGISPSSVADLVSGKWEMFGLETLITLEARAGRQVTLELAG